MTDCATAYRCLLFRELNETEADFTVWSRYKRTDFHATNARSKLRVCPDREVHGRKDFRRPMQHHVNLIAELKTLNAQKRDSLSKAYMESDDALLDVDDADGDDGRMM